MPNRGGVQNVGSDMRRPMTLSGDWSIVSNSKVTSSMRSDATERDGISSLFQKEVKGRELHWLAEGLGLASRSLASLELLRACSQDCRQSPSLLLTSIIIVRKWFCHRAVMLGC